MQSVMRVAFAVLLLSAITVSFEQSAYAYVDPGSGLLLMQTIGSMLACAAIYFRRNILGFFQKETPHAEGEFPAGEDQGTKATTE